MDKVKADRTILLAGDWAPIGKYERLVLEDPEAVYGDLLETLRAADLRVVNLETPLCDTGDPLLKDGPNLRGDPRAVESLACVPFDVACLANNHILDFPPDSMDDTIAALEELGIAAIPDIPEDFPLTEIQAAES